MQRMMSRSFEEHLETLQLLSGNLGTADFFAQFYEELLAGLRKELEDASTAQDVLTVRRRGEQLIHITHNPI